MTPLWFALTKGFQATESNEAAKVLVDAGADLKAGRTSWDHLTLLYWAADYKNSEGVKLMIEAGDDCTEN